MSTNLFLHRYTVHVPSIARARVMPTLFLRRPMIYIDCHNGRDMEVIYPIGKWDQAKKEYEALQKEMLRCQIALSQKEEEVVVTVPQPVHRPDSDSDSESDCDKCGKKMR